MRLWIDGTLFEGDAIDLRPVGVDGATIVAAILGECLSPLIACAEPSDLFQYTGHVTSDMGLRTRTALAAAARSVGQRTKFDDEIGNLRRKITRIAPERPQIPTAPDPVPERTVRELEETVATHRGRIEAHETGADGAGSEARDELQSAVIRLTERATEQRAAEQTRQRRREAARAYRDQLAKRRELADRLANRERSARAILVERLADDFSTALEKLPGQTPSDPFNASAVDAALAIRRIAQTDTPVVLEAGRFSSLAAAASYLDAPLIRC